ncbi:MAG: type IX secretion system membrane protein PorP/SprF [Cytophagaceae bacterium]|jgi:type IX secretion system PorP/SprF family membrane protein|nr:type IX secretion system membrane protein PorP/SprF [Cytophagaceae bacterium]
MKVKLPEYSILNPRKLLYLVLFTPFLTFAQDIQFSQFYSVPLYQNPAFAGSAHAFRGIAHTRLQWVGLDANYKTMYISGDGYSSRYRSGFGFQIFRDIQGSNIISTNDYSLQYAYELPVSKSFTVRAGLQATASNRTLNYSSLTFPGQYDDNQGFIGTPGYPNGIESKWYPDISSGILAYSDKLWGGFSVHHMNMPNQAFAGGGSANLPMKFAVTGGYKINLSKRKYLAYTDEEPEISITPTFHYKSQGKSDQLDLGVYGIYNQLMAGVWYRGIPVKRFEGFQNNESMILLVGWMYKSWSIAYSYDIVVSKLTTARSGGAHEINLTYIYKPTKKYKPMRRLPCPSFYKH